MRKKYVSDISRKQFELIRADLESVRKKTKPRTIDYYDIFCAILYVLKSGCQWRMLPSDFPRWETVYRHFAIFNPDPSLEIRIVLFYLETAQLK